MLPASLVADLRSPEAMGRRLWILKTALSLLGFVLAAALVLDWLGFFLGWLPRALVYGWLLLKGTALVWSTRSHLRGRVSLATLVVNPAVDLLGITAAVYLTGGPASPAVLFYVIEAVSVALFENGSMAVGLSLFATLCYAAMCTAVAHGWLPALTLLPTAPLRMNPGPWEVATQGIWLGAATLLAALFASHVTGLLRRRERDLTGEVERNRALLAAVSHESRTPLQGILGLTSLLREGSYGRLPRKARWAVLGVEAASKRILRLSQTLLDLSRVEAGSAVLLQEAVEAKAVVRAAVAQARWYTGGRKIHFHTELPEAIPPAKGDAAKVEQILVTLLIRAVQATQDGRVAVVASSGGGEVTFAVEEASSRLEAEEVALLFEPFSGKGDSGLGLHVARVLARAMQGRVEAETLPAGGMRLRLALPAWGG